MRRTTMHALLLTALPLWSTCGAAAAAATEELDDTEITLAVERQLILEDAVPSHRIDVSTDAGIVTLSGSVNSILAKLQAKNTAESVKGVIAVINNILVRPTARLDSQIYSDVISALALDPVSKLYRIDVSVTDGIVTLEGEVGSHTERQAAEEVAQEVRGVVSVHNRLTYDLVADRTDSEIREDVAYRLRSNASVDAGLITVTVEDGNVTLEGTVRSAWEKSIAEDQARIVLGVAAVENELDVKWWADIDTGDLAAGWTDDDMQQAVENALLTNPRVNRFTIATSVNNGVARLIGTVDNLRAKREAEREALTTTS